MIKIEQLNFAHIIFYIKSSLKKVKLYENSIKNTAEIQWVWMNKKPKLYSETTVRVLNGILCSAEFNAIQFLWFIKISNNWRKFFSQGENVEIKHEISKKSAIYEWNWMFGCQVVLVSSNISANESFKQLVAYFNFYFSFISEFSSIQFIAG